MGWPTLLVFFAASASAELGDVCFSDLQPPNGTDALVEECKPWCSQAKQTLHCPRCRCRGCTFCAGYNPPSPPPTSPALPPPAQCTPMNDGDTDYEACFGWCSELLLLRRSNPRPSGSRLACCPDVWSLSRDAFTLSRDALLHDAFRQRRRSKLRPMQVPRVRLLPRSSGAAFAAAATAGSVPTAVIGVATDFATIRATCAPAAVHAATHAVHAALGFRHRLRGLLPLVRQQPGGQLSALQMQGLRRLQTAEGAAAASIAARAAFTAAAVGAAAGATFTTATFGSTGAASAGAVHSDQRWRHRLRGLLPVRRRATSSSCTVA